MPLSRSKKNIARDFSDGVLMAEVVAAYFPRYVDVHNYVSANGLAQKLCNWNTLNCKVLRKLGFMLHPQDIDECTRVRIGECGRGTLCTFRRCPGRLSEC